METIAFTASDIERFWVKVDKSGDCWIWQAAILHGYGRFCSRQQGKRKVHAAHRVAYTLLRGEIPAGYVLDHMCRQPACVNPEHLRAVTAKQNAEHRGGPNANNTTSGVLGVYWRNDRNLWEVRVRHDGKTRRYGRYKTIPEAEAVAVAVRNSLYTHNDLDRG